MAESAWAPVVYARIRRVDSWWRALPAASGDVDHGGTGSPSAGSPWLAGPVLAVVQGGRELAAGPRFLLARHGSRHLVGVACRAVDLEPAMASDGTRDLYCFVGWVGTGAVPPLALLRRSYPEWAGAEYRRWVGPDWDASPSEDRAPRSTTPGPPPWSDEWPQTEPEPRVESGFRGDPASAAGAAVEAVALPPAPVSSGRVHVWPEHEAHLLWQAVAAGPTDPTHMVDAVLVTGLRVARRSRVRGLTHAASADTSERYLLESGSSTPVPGSTPTAAVDHAEGGRTVLQVLSELLRRLRW